MKTSWNVMALAIAMVLMCAAPVRAAHSISLFPQASPNNVVTASPNDMLDLYMEIANSVAGASSAFYYSYDINIDVIATPSNGAPPFTLYHEFPMSGFHTFYERSEFCNSNYHDTEAFNLCGSSGVNRVLRIGAHSSIPTVGDVRIPCLPILPSPHYYAISVKIVSVNGLDGNYLTTDFNGVDVNGTPFSFNVAHNTQANVVTPTIMKVYMSYPITNVSAIVTDASVCYPGNGSIDITASNTVAPYFFQWSGPNGYSYTLEDPTNLAPGLYNVTVTDSRHCHVYAAYTVDNDATTAFALNITQPAQTCVGKTRRIHVTDPEPYCTYTWYYPALGGSVVGTGSTLCVEPTAAGNFTYRVDADCGGCLGSGTVTLSVLASGAKGCSSLPNEAACGDPTPKTHPIEPVAKVEVYPNPFNGQLHLNLPEAWQIPATAQVYTLNGQLVHSKELEGQSTAVLHLHDLPKGGYLLRLDNGAGQIITQLITHE